MLKYLLRIIINQNKEIYILNDCLESTRRLLQREREKNQELIKRMQQMDYRFE